MAARVAGKDAVAERLAPAGDAGVGVDADEQHVDGGAGPAAEHRRRPVDHHRQVEDDALDARDLHAQTATQRLTSRPVTRCPVAWRYARKWGVEL